MKPSTKRILLIVLAVVLLGGLVAWTINSKRNKKEGTPIEYGEAVSRRIEERVSASGRIFPVTEVALSSDVSGEVVLLEVAEGDSVRQGQLMARIDPDTYESQVSQASAGVNASRAQAANARASIEQFKAQRTQQQALLATAELAVKRARSLNQEGLLSDADLEQAENQVATTTANIQAAEANIRAAEETANAADFNVQSSQAQLDQFRVSLRRTNITSPMTGIVSLLSVEEGERVVGTSQMAGTEMARIADLSQMEVQVEVSENDIPRVNLGDSVDIEVDAYLDRKFAGTVTEISSSANNLTSASGIQSLTTDQVTNFVVTIGISPASYADLVTPKRPYPFRPGMSAAVDILTEVVPDAIAVPIAAVTAREPEKQKGSAPQKSSSSRELEEIVWVITEADTVARRKVSTGVQDRDFIQVTEGLEVGDKVAVGPYSAVSRKLKAGGKVYAQDEEGNGNGGDDSDDDDDE